MRFIDPTHVELGLTPEWKKKAGEALKKVSAKQQEERAAEIDNHSDVWRELKPLLSEISHGKCWYCETKEDRSDNAVDHYRPKNRVKEKNNGKGGDGYWWLAFEWRNYRFCCGYCNSYRRRPEEAAAAGKQDHFPVQNVWVEDEAIPYEDLDDEQPLLLDPTKASDVGLLAFEEDGSVVSTWPEESQPFEFKRATESIKHYHLFDQRLVDLRHEVMIKVHREAKAADRNVRKFSRDQTDMSARSAYDANLAYLFGSVRPKAQFSACARTALRALRGTSKTAEYVLDYA